MDANIDKLAAARLAADRGERLDPIVAARVGQANLVALVALRPLALSSVGSIDRR